ncbi:MAG: tetratricopeptide repeat protein [Bacillota bacterium]|jgi:hypothetical protein
MISAELKLQTPLSYKELVDHLHNKYGPAKYDYFDLPYFDVVNSNVLRLKEGLFCHHIDEDKAIRLDEKEYAQKNPYEYQLKDRLVYANLLEYLLLRIKIILEPPHPNANRDEKIGVTGLDDILSTINDYYNGSVSEDKYLTKAVVLIENNFDDYIEILRNFIKILMTKLDDGKSRLQYARWLSQTKHLLDGPNVVFEKLLDPDKEDLIPNEELMALETNATNGDAEAQIRLGDLYRIGNNVKQDKKRSFYYMSMAAEQGSAYAIIMIGKFYDIGFGVKPNPKKSFEYFMSAAQAEIDQAMFEVGICYLQGKGVPQDKEEAINWLTRAAEKGYEKAKVVLENYYSNMN